METEKIKQLQQWVDQSDRIVFFGGAGVSTESGIPDFRSQDGLYHQQYDVPPETILSHTYFERHTAEFYRFYRNKMICLTAKPNAAHKKLAELEQAGKLLAVVTQNIDGLHQLAGSRSVLELHGSVHRNICQVCGAVYDAEWIMMTTGVPHCDKCGGRVKPDVVLYEESLPEDTLTRSVNAIANADLLLVGGTSLTVYPAAGLLRYFRGEHLVLLNRDATPMDEQADLCIREPIGKVLEQIQVRDQNVGTACKTRKSHRRRQCHRCNRTGVSGAAGHCTGGYHGDHGKNGGQAAAAADLLGRKR